MIFRRKRSENKSSNERATPLQLEDLRSGSADTTSSTANLVYQNLVDIRPSEKGAVFLVLFYRLYKSNCQVDPFFNITFPYQNSNASVVELMVLTLSS